MAAYFPIWLPINSRNVMFVSHYCFCFEVFLIQLLWLIHVIIIDLKKQTKNGRQFNTFTAQVVFQNPTAHRHGRLKSSNCFF